MVSQKALDDLKVEYAKVVAQHDAQYAALKQSFEARMHALFATFEVCWSRGAWVADTP